MYKKLHTFFYNNLSNKIKDIIQGNLNNHDNTIFLMIGCYLGYISTFRIGFQ